MVDLPHSSWISKSLLQPLVYCAWDELNGLSPMVRVCCDGNLRLRACLCDLVGYDTSYHVCYRSLAKSDAGAILPFGPFQVNDDGTCATKRAFRHGYTITVSVFRVSSRKANSWLLMLYHLVCFASPSRLRRPSSTLLTGSVATLVTILECICP
jgi:hypothetical protein